jgi:hypothetical protein
MSHPPRLPRHWGLEVSTLDHQYSSSSECYPADKMFIQKKAHYRPLQLAEEMMRKDRKRFGHVGPERGDREGDQEKEEGRVDGISIRGR